MPLSPVIALRKPAIVIHKLMAMAEDIAKNFDADVLNAAADMIFESRAPAYLLEAQAPVTTPEPVYPDLENARKAAKDWQDIRQPQPLQTIAGFDAKQIEEKCLDVMRQVRRLHINTAQLTGSRMSDCFEAIKSIEAAVAMLPIYCGGTRLETELSTTYKKSYTEADPIRVAADAVARETEKKIIGGTVFSPPGEDEHAKRRSTALVCDHIFQAGSVICHKCLLSMREINDFKDEAAAFKTTEV